MKLCVPSVALTIILLSHSTHSRGLKAKAKRCFEDIYNNQQTISSLQNTKFQLRDATKADIDDITTIVIDAFAPSALWHYIRPYDGEYKELDWYCAREDIATSWSHINWNETWIKVITVPDEQLYCHDQLGRGSNRRARREKAVALAVWKRMKRDQHMEYELSDHTNMSRDFRSLLPPVAPFTLGITQKSSLGCKHLLSSETLTRNYNCSIRPDINFTRLGSYQEQFNPLINKYIYSAYTDQLNLALLATHPTWDGHGFAAHNLRWGMELAQSLGLDEDREGGGVPVTLIGTPAGYPVYDSVGFESIKNITVQMLDGLGELWWEVMRWNGTAEYEKQNV